MQTLPLSPLSGPRRGFPASSRHPEQDFPLAGTRPETRHSGKRLLPPSRHRARGAKQPVSKEREDGCLSPPARHPTPALTSAGAGDGTEPCLETGERRRKIRLQEHEVKVN